MMPRSSLLIACLALLATLQAAPAIAQNNENPFKPEFGLGIGYANITIGSDSAVSGEGAIRFDPTVGISPIQALPQLRLGADLGVSLVLDNSSRTLTIGSGGATYTGSSDVPLWTLEPEIRLSWRQDFGGTKNPFFIEPGVAAGQMFAHLDLQPDPADEAQGSLNASDSTPYGRVFLRAGVPVPQGWFGLEASYLSGGHLDFGQNLAGHVTEYYIGLMGAIKF
jgi:hypothetical protein